MYISIISTQKLIATISSQCKVTMCYQQLKCINLKSVSFLYYDKTSTVYKSEKIHLFMLCMLVSTKSKTIEVSYIYKQVNYIYIKLY